MKRDVRNIWTIWKRASEKKNAETKTTAVMHFPLRITQDRRLSPLEAVVKYLRDSGIKNSQIATALGRSRKTISTAYKRAKKK